MNTQSTPVHIHLWHHDFWRMAMANLLLSMSMCILIPSLPRWLLLSRDMTAAETGEAMAAFGLGLFLPGGFVSFLVQHYRRNMVCVWAILGLAVCLAVLYYAVGQHVSWFDFWLVFLLRLLMGCTFGLAQMVLSSTLIIDTCESFQRTEANHAAAWFGRFALALGPLTALIVSPLAGFRAVVLVAGGCAVLSLLLVLLAHFPFRAPADDVRLFCLDRFFLPQGWPLFANLLLVTVAVGLVLSLPLTVRFYSMLTVGFLLAIVAQRFVFRDAELKSEVVSGLLLLAAALLMLITRTQSVVFYLAPVLTGFGVGVIGSRFLLFFIKLSRHCQRGTSQSTFMLGWESGLVFGLGLGFAIADVSVVLFLSLSLVVVSLVLYHFTHNWFVQHKNR